MNTSGEFLLDRGIWGWLYKLLTPLEWLMTQVMVLFHKFLTLLGMAPIGISWVLAIVFLVLVVHALYFADLSQADEVDAQDAGLAAQDAAYSEQVQGQKGSGQQRGHEP